MTSDDQMPDADDVDDAMPEVDDDVWQRSEDEAKEEDEAQRRLSTIAAGRRKGGVMGAAMAGAMMALQEIYQGPQKDEMVAVSESPDEPGDIDKDGILISVGDVDVKTELPETD